MNKKLLVTGIISFIVIAVGISAVFYHISAVDGKYDNVIYPGVSIENVDVSGKTAYDAKKIIEEKYQNLMQNKRIVIKAGDNNYTTTYGKLSAKYNIDEVVDETFNYGKNLNLYNKYKLINSPEKKTYKLKFTYNAKPLDEVINIIKKDVNKDAVNAKITKQGSGFNIVPDVDGAKLNDTQLKTDIINSINNKPTGDTTVQAKIDTVKANATKEKLKGVNTLISTFSLDYASISSPGRCVNIQLATKTINGTFLMPGDSFNFNNTVGERTAEKGYQSAPVDIGNKSGMGLGGGICQVSTTLYNAVLLAGVKATIRNHHSIPSVYVPLGYDATVDWGTLDYAFKNTLAFPMYIEGSADNGHITFNIYSDSSLLSKQYKLENEVYQEMQPTTVYQDDPTLPAGTTQVDQNPSVGHKVKVYLETFQNGTMISKDMITNDTYNAINQVIKRGTKK